MKKTFTLILSLALSLLALQASAQMYIVGDGPFGGWGSTQPNGGVTMTDNGNGTYSYTAAVTGEVYFVFADGRSNSKSPPTAPGPPRRRRETMAPITSQAMARTMFSRSIPPTSVSRSPVGAATPSIPRQAISTSWAKSKAARGTPVRVMK